MQSIVNARYDNRTGKQYEDMGAKDMGTAQSMLIKRALNWMAKPVFMTEEAEVASQTPTEREWSSEEKCLVQDRDEHGSLFDPVVDRTDPQNVRNLPPGYVGYT